MEVSGRKQKTSFPDTCEDDEVFCQSCSSDGDWVVAMGYCRNCHEYFCATCLRLHRKQTLSRNHKIVEGEKVPKANMSSVTISAYSELCHKHTNEIIKLYCPSHDVVGCGYCMVLDHKACKVDRIEDVSRHFFNGAKHHDLQQKIDQFLRNIEQVNKEMKTNEKTMQQTYSKAEHDIKSFKKEIIDYLDKAEADLLAELNKRKLMDEKLISSIKENETAMRAKIQELHERLQLQFNQANELFVSANEVKERITHVGDTIKQLQHDCHFRQYEFVCSEHVREMLTSHNNLGQLLVTKQIAGEMIEEVVTVKKKDLANMEPRFDYEIDIKASDDSRDCLIEDCALISSSQIALVDASNYCVKIVDTKNRNIVAKYELISAPKGVTAVTSSCLAVTIPSEQKILFLAISQNGKLSYKHDIKVNGRCEQTDCKGNKLIIAFSDHDEIRNINGKMIKSISHQCEKYYIYIAIDHDLKTYYVTNGKKGDESVLKYDLDGNLIATYSDKDLPTVSGISVTKDGLVFACNWGRNGGIHIISPECKKIREILKESKHVRFPLCVVFCDETNKLFLCNYELNLDSELKNALKVFQLK